MVAKCQKEGTNATKLRFAAQDSVSVKSIADYLCLGSLSPLEDNRSAVTVTCPLDGSVSEKGFAGKLCSTC